MNLVPIVCLALASLWNRRVTAGLTVVAIGLSVALLLCVETVRRDARESFANTVSGTDLIVGARSGSLPLLLYSVFRIGNATNNVSWQSYQKFADDRRVRWAVPLSLGDSHRGFRVLGTTAAYFLHYRYASRQRLSFAHGKPFAERFEVVLGASVAQQLGYQLGDEITLSHGQGVLELERHDAFKFSVKGILARTGTPVDRTVHVGLQAVTAIHAPSSVAAAGGSRSQFLLSFKRPQEQDLTPTSVTAFMLGVNSKLAIFRVQRDVNQFADEPLLAILPGVALQELWDLMGLAETLLRLISAMVVFTGLVGMLTVILSSLESRRREMAILRSVGARPSHVFALFMSEAGVLACAGAGLGTALMFAVVWLAQPWVSSAFGLHLPLPSLTSIDVAMLAIVIVSGTAMGAVPALRAYAMSLADGLSVRV